MNARPSSQVGSSPWMIRGLGRFAFPEFTFTFHCGAQKTAAMSLPGSRRPAALSRPSAAAVPGVVSKVTSASPLMFRQSRLLAWRDILAACGVCGVCCHRARWPSARAAPAAGQRAAPGAETARDRVPHAPSKKGRQLKPEGVCAAAGEPSVALRLQFPVFDTTASSVLTALGPWLPPPMAAK